MLFCLMVSLLLLIYFSFTLNILVLEYSHVPQRGMSREASILSHLHDWCAPVMLCDIAIGKKGKKALQVARSA